MNKSRFFTGQPVFSQLLHLIPSDLISAAASDNQSNRYYKKFKAQDHLVTMLYTCYHRCCSIREVTTGMEACHNKLLHLGMQALPRRSTLSEANRNRNARFFEQVYHRLYERYYKKVFPDSSRQRSIESRLFLMDSTTISLFADVMKGAGSAAANGKRKGGAKAHVLFDAAAQVPALIRITEGSRNDRVFMPDVKLPSGSILVFDKGYHHFARWQQWTDDRITWVTRLIDTEYVEIQDEKEVSEDQKRLGVERDCRIRLGKGTNKATLPVHVRLIVYKDPQTGKVFSFLTNNNRFYPSTVAELYRKRWWIELFFKRLKQHNPLRCFLGDNENAIKIQIWTAFIADLLIKIVKDSLKRNWAFANLAALIRHHLMNYIHLTTFLNNPEKLTLQPARINGQLLLFDS